MNKTMDRNECFRLLGIQPTEDKEIIKKAFKKMAFKYHPDKNKAPDAEEKFKEINEAYQTLLKPKPNNVINMGNMGNMGNNDILRQMFNSNIFTFINMMNNNGGIDINRMGGIGANRMGGIDINRMGGIDINRMGGIGENRNKSKRRVETKIIGNKKIETIYEEINGVVIKSKNITRI